MENGPTRSASKFDRNFTVLLLNRAVMIPNPWQGRSLARGTIPSRFRALNKTAGRDHLSPRKANGEVIGPPSVGARKFHGLKLMPGDTNLAAEDLERIRKLHLIKAVSDLKYKITLAIGAAALIVF